MTKAAPMVTDTGAPSSITDAMAKAKKGGTGGSTPISIRLDNETLSRIQRLASGDVPKGPLSASYVEMTITQLIRAALDIGLDQLEREHGIAPPKK